MSFFNEKELNIMASLSTEWKRLAEDNVLWKRLSLRRWHKRKPGIIIHSKRRQQLNSNFKFANHQFWMNQNFAVGRTTFCRVHEWIKTGSIQITPFILSSMAVLCCASRSMKIRSCPDLPTRRSKVQSPNPPSHMMCSLEIPKSNC